MSLAGTSQLDPLYLWPHLLYLLKAIADSESGLANPRILTANIGEGNIQNSAHQAGWELWLISKEYLALLPRLWPMEGAFIFMLLQHGQENLQDTFLWNYSKFHSSLENGWESNSLFTWHTHSIITVLAGQLRLMSVEMIFILRDTSFVYWSKPIKGWHVVLSSIFLLLKTKLPSKYSTRLDSTL
jgi:hypothetical protein